MIAICAAVLFTAAQDANPFDSRDAKYREYLLKEAGGSKETEAAVQRALEWLARNQRADHTWPVPEKRFTVGVTALSVLAFMGNGHGPKSPTYGEVVRRGVQYLLSQQDPEGCVGARWEKYMYSHILATTALAEAQAMSPGDSTKGPAQKAVDFLVAAQTPDKGWRYSSQCGESDTSVTGWAVLALRSAERAMLAFPKKTFLGAVAWLDQVTNKEGRTTYQGTPHDALRGLEEQFDVHESMTAIGVLARVVMTRRRMDERLGVGLDRIAKDPPKWGKTSVDYVYWHLGTRAMFEADGHEMARWKPWNEAMKKALLASQTTEGPEAGSWETMDRWCWDGGRACTTALNALTLETYYRYILRFGADEK